MTAHNTPSLNDLHTWLQKLLARKSQSLDSAELLFRTALDLSGITIRRLHPQLFDLPQLATLNLRDTGISVFPLPKLRYGIDFQQPPAFTSAENLIDIDASNNDIRTLSADIQHFTRLEKLNLNHNQLSALPPEISALQQLRELSLRENELRRLPTEIGNLTNLEVLDLANNNGLSELPEAIGKLRKLKILNLSRTDITALPDSITALTALTELHLPASLAIMPLPSHIAQYLHEAAQNGMRIYGRSDFSPAPRPVRSDWATAIYEWADEFELDEAIIPRNKQALTELQVLDCHLIEEDVDDDDWGMIAYLPPEIGHLQQLHSIDISKNCLSDLPSELAQLSKLKSLNIARNQFTELPPVICQLTQLEYLHCHENSIATLPPEIERLHQLKHLDLKDNILETSTLALGNLQQLQTINLSGTMIFADAEHISALGQLSELRELDLSNCACTALSFPLAKLRKLEKLYLHYNGLASLPQDFQHLQVLTTLDLTDCSFKEFPLVITKLAKLQKLYLDGNELNDLPTDITTLKQLKTLHVDDNPLNTLNETVKDWLQRNHWL